MKIKTAAKNALRKAVEKTGHSLIASNGYYEACFDLEREYKDPEGSPLPRFTLRKEPPTPWAGNITRFIVDNGKSVLEECIFYSHLTLLKMCKDFAFHSVLDIGSHERRVTRIFEHLGKKVTTIELSPGYEADYKEDYSRQTFPEKFDAIWCSQTYEHQRNPGAFLDKIFDDLKEGGVLALTVPYQISRSVLFGHINITSPLMLLYQLVCAGFDCSEVCLKCYNGNIGVLLKKKYNGIKRGLPFGAIPLQKGTPEETKALLGEEFFPNMESSFPAELREDVRANYLDKKILAINW